MGKIIRARDAFFEACSYIVQQDSAIRHPDSPSKMSRKHLALVRDLRDSEVELSSFPRPIPAESLHWTDNLLVCQPSARLY